MTEEEFANLSDEEFAQYEAEHQDEEVIMETNEDESSQSDPEPEAATDTPEVEEVNENESEETEIIEDTAPEPEVEEEGEPEEDTQETPETEAAGEEENTQNSEEDTYDYKASYTTLMAPIKANGQEMQIKSPEDARRLIQMGLNYDDKMVAIKPVRLAGKALERAGIIKDGVIDEDALNRMIDFNNGDIEVMKARLKELDINPLDLDVEDVNYQAQDHMVSEHSIELDDIQRELDTRGSTEKVVNALNSMDAGSKEFFSENPQRLLNLEQDITNGVFDEIYGNVLYEKRMGRLGGKSDIEAYIEFAQSRATDVTPEKPEVVQKPKKIVDTKKRAKAAGSKPAPSQPTEVVNPFELSDEEFEKQFGIGQAIR